MKFKIVYVKSIPQDFIGMNYFAAKSHKIQFPNKQNLIWVKKGMTKDLRDSTIQHEKMEIVLMKNRKMKYHKAHIISNSMEEF
jgi:hypothetical protein